MKQWMGKHKWSLGFAAVTLAALAARIIWMVKIPNVPVSDFHVYWDIAKNVYNDLGISQRGEPKAFQGPFYPMVLGVWYKLVGTTSIFAGKILNVILSMATLLVFYSLLKRLFSRPGVVLLAYAFAAFLPNYIAYNSTLGTEILYTFLMVVTLRLQFSELKGRLRYPLMGVFIALTALTRPYFIVYPVIVAAAEWIRRKSWKETVIAGAVTAIVALAVISPWTIRNWKVFDTFVLVASNDGYVLFVNNNDNNWFGGWMHPDQIQVSEEFVAKFEEIGVPYPEHPPQANELYKEEAMRWIWANPVKFLELGVIRVKNTFFNGAEDVEKWTMNEYRQNRPSMTLVDLEREIKFARSVSDIIIYVISSFGLIYVLLHVKDLLLSLLRKKTTITFGAAVLCMNIALYPAVFFVSEGQPRYNFPVLILLILATVASIEILGKHRRESDLR